MANDNDNDKVEQSIFQRVTEERVTWFYERIFIESKENVREIFFMTHVTCHQATSIHFCSAFRLLGLEIQQRFTTHNIEKS